MNQLVICFDRLWIVRSRWTSWPSKNIKPHDGQKLEFIFYLFYLFFCLLLFHIWLQLTLNLFWVINIDRLQIRTRWSRSISNYFLSLAFIHYFFYLLLLLMSRDIYQVVTNLFVYFYTMKMLWGKKSPTPYIPHEGSDFKCYGTWRMRMEESARHVADNCFIIICLNFIGYTFSRQNPFMDNEAWKMIHQIMIQTSYFRKDIFF